MPKEMTYMKGYSNSYKPPSGSAGVEAKGEYSHKSNPRSVPKKGSALGSDSPYGMNADKSKVKGLQAEQRSAESLRGYGC